MKHLEIALGEYGKEAYFGDENNAEIIKYFHETGYDYVDDDETPWCAAFLNWVMRKSGIATPNKLNARSFLDIGQTVGFPQLGDVAVLWRIAPEHWAGHVGIFIRETRSMVYLLGGNQDSSVRIKAFSKSQLLGYRRVV